VIHRAARAFVAAATIVVLAATAEGSDPEWKGSDPDQVVRRGLTPTQFTEQTRGGKPPSTRASRRAIDQLRRDLQAIFGTRAVDHAQWSVIVKSLRSGDTLYTLNSNRLQVPASNQKLITSAVAAERLGWDYRYTTRIYATAPISADGTIDGNLVVTSNGDPTINPRHPERWGVFDEWAQHLAARGIRLIGGLLIGDDNAFAEPGWAPGWSWDDIALGYGASVSALQYNENQVELLIGPGQEAGARAIISTSPAGSGLTVDHQVTTAPAGAETRVTFERIPGSKILSVRGEVALGAPALTEYAAVPNPTEMYVNALREALARHGIFLGGVGVPVDIDDVRLVPDLTKATLLIEDRSPPLSEIIDVTLKWSRNIYAETLVMSMAPEGQPATTEAGLMALKETMEAWQIPAESYLARDGSGLSRYDYLSADALLALLTRVWSEPKLAATFKTALPVAGVSGSLANRMRETPAQGRVFAKTGSMSQVRSLAGYVTTLSEEPLVFAIIVNGFRVPSREIDAIVHQALVRLVSYK
jgi:D-alanyl-D-alanine carboxypeptidase/D-alanyl-D-alanine-endopeptidase (penicillin-binding protein 4)